MGIREFLNELREGLRNAFRRDDRRHAHRDVAQLNKVEGQGSVGPVYPAKPIGTRAATPVALTARSLEARSIVDAKGALWLPSARDVPSPDRRFGKPALIIENSTFIQRELKIWDSLGAEIGKLGYFSGNTRDRAEWYSGYGLGSHDTAIELSDKARRAGTGEIYIEWAKGYVLGPIMPTQLTGSL